MTLRRIAPGVLVALLACVPAAAQQSQTPAAPPASRYMDPVNGLTLEQAIARALEEEPSLRADRARIAAAQGLRQQAGLRANPSASFERREEPGGLDTLTTLMVEWPLELFRRGARVVTAEREVAAMRLAVADRERVLAFEVRARYGDVLAALRQLSTLDEIVAAARRQHELVRARADEGAAPPLERDLVEVELRRLEAERLLQAGRADAALVDLKRVLGMSADAPLALGETLENVVQRESTSTSASNRDDDGAPVGQARADVREAEARVEVADAKVDQAASEGRIDVSLFGGYMAMEAGFPQRAFGAAGALEPVHGRFHYLSAGARVTLPLFDRNQGAIAAAEAERDGAAAGLEAVRLAADAEVAAARARDEHARQAVRLYAAGGRDLARRNLGVVSQSYELGRATIFDVLAEQRRFLDLERAYTDTLTAAFEARTALDRALGELP